MNLRKEKVCVASEQLNNCFSKVGNMLLTLLVFLEEHITVLDTKGALSTYFSRIHFSFFKRLSHGRIFRGIFLQLSSLSTAFTSHISLLLEESEYVLSMCLQDSVLSLTPPTRCLAEVGTTTAVFLPYEGLCYAKYCLMLPS